MPLPSPLSGVFDLVLNVVNLCFDVTYAVSFTASGVGVRGTLSHPVRLHNCAGQLLAQAK